MSPLCGANNGLWLGSSMGGGKTGSIGDAIFGGGIISDVLDPVGFLLKGTGTISDPSKSTPAQLQNQAIIQQLQLAQEAAERERTIFGTAEQGALSARDLVNQLGTTAGQTQDILGQQGQLAQRLGAGREFRRRQGLDQAGATAGDFARFVGQAGQPQAGLIDPIAQRQLGLSGQASQIGGQAANQLFGLGQQFQAPGFTNQLQNLAQQFGQPGAQGRLGEIGASAIGEAGRSALNINPNVAGLQGLSQAALGSGLQTQQELSGLRGQGLDVLGQAIQGQIPDAVSNLFSPEGAVAERDVLERQFDVARRNITERGGQRGSGLSRNLASLEAQRALSLAESEARRDEAERQAGLGLFSQALGQGLSAPGQLQSALGLGGGLLGQAGSQQLGAEQLRQGALGLGADITGLAGQQRLAGLSGATGALGTAGQQRLSGLTGAAGAAGAGGQQGLAGLGLASNIAQQAGQAQLQGQDLNRLQQAQQAGLLGQNFAQQLQLAQQQGAGGDALLFGTVPELAQNQVGLSQLLAQSQGIPTSIFSGTPVTPASQFLGPAAGNLTQSVLQANQQQAAAQAGLGQGLGSLAGLFLGGMFGGGVGAPIGSAIGGQLGSGLFGGNATSGGAFTRGGKGG